ncbi:MAG: ABC transporter ATP-binding protein [Candidatus Puniceispirillaceae bacterium]
MSKIALSLRDVCQHFVQGEAKIGILKGANLEIETGKMVALIGPSGAGKTSLLNIAGMLEAPSSGEVAIAGQDISRLRSAKKAAFRRDHIGFVFQTHRLLPEFTAAENIAIPQMLNGLNRYEAQTRALQLLAMIGLEERAKHRPGQLSGGEQQRVAIARAVANAPSLLLADEPTGNLDPETGQIVFQTLRQIIKGTGASALIVTHNMQLAQSMDKVYLLDNGQVREAAV